MLNPSLELDLLFSVSVPGQSLSKRVLRYAEHPKLVSALVALRAKTCDVERLDASTLEFLRAEHVLVRPGEAPKKPSFVVDGSKALRDLLPAHPSCPRASARAGLEVTPGMVLQVGPRRPAKLSAVDQLPAPIPKGRAVLWVPDARTQMRRPHWPSTAALRALERYRRGARISTSPESEELALYGALSSKAEREHAQASWQHALGMERQRLATHGYAILRGLLSSVQLAALRRYTRALRGQGYCDRELPSQQVEGRYFIHQERVASSMHAQLAAIINELTPERVKPSYCYLSTYARGSVLRRHVDRAQCAWNLSLVIDAEPELPAEQMWPIHLDVKDGPAHAALAIGDAVLYSGTQVPHWRDALAEHDLFTACFYHFVPIDFAEALR